MTLARPDLDPELRELLSATARRTRNDWLARVLAPASPDEALRPALGANR